MRRKGEGLVMASWKSASSSLASWKSVSWKFAVLGVGLLLGGCIQTTLEPASNAAMTGRDKELLAHPPYAQAAIPEPFQRHIVDYHRKEAPGTIVIDTDNKFLYLVQANGKAIRYGVTVGEEAQGWSGVAKIGNMTEWPSWTPTAGEHQRLDGLPSGRLPDHLAGGPANPMGARAMYLYANGKDTLYRIHGTNQPEYIGQAISSGCIRLTNENAIDLYSRVKVGTTVVVLAPGQGDSPYNPKLALGNIPGRD
jgi:lipoprotein-anchoring transpeptidase ErfK/SrfK